MTGISTNDSYARLKTGPIKGIWPHMSLRSLSAMLIAFAMLFAPLAMQSGAAVAMAPADHHSQMMDKGTCGDQPAKDKGGKTVDKSCCVAMCAAIAVAPSAQAEQHAFSQPAERPALEQFRRSYMAELPTPPPRLA